MKKAGVPARAAFDENLTHYKEQIPALFWFNALLIASNGTDSRGGSLTADWERFFEWKRIEREDEPRRLNSAPGVSAGKSYRQLSADSVVRVSSSASPKIRRMDQTQKGTRSTKHGSRMETKQHPDALPLPNKRPRSCERGCIGLMTFTACLSPFGVLLATVLPRLPI